MLASMVVRALVAVLPLTYAQFPSTPSDMTVVKSKVNPEVTISFKETHICEQTKGVKAYSGYVHLPGRILSDTGSYNVNTYFLYFKARKNAATAPLGIYLAGGPGQSSTYAALSSENGPCYVNIEATDTINNPWSFNNDVNMLYVDQPVDSGFSYSKLVNSTYALVSEGEEITPFDFDPSSPPPVNASAGFGTYPDQNANLTSNTTVLAAKALWHFAEHWLSSFPGYKTQSNQISIWGNSYGGYWVPGTAAQLTKGFQNLSSQHPLHCKSLRVDAIGLTNGCIDLESSGLGYPVYAFNNTYGVKLASQAEYEEELHNFTTPKGCRDLLNQCRALGEKDDPAFSGSNADVNEACAGASELCLEGVFTGGQEAKNHSQFDIAEKKSLCPFWLPVLRYLNNATTQQALGVPLNFTFNPSVTIANFFKTTGDPGRQNGLPNIEYLLASGVKVALIHGDRDFRCPWTGGELLSLAAKWSGQAGFASAGYQMMQGVRTPLAKGGLRALVKQHGKLAFARVMDAGHTTSAYAPETVYRIFQRTIYGSDVVTGQKAATDDYSTTGPRDSWGWRNTLPKDPPQTCIVNGEFTKENPWVPLAAALGVESQ